VAVAMAVMPTIRIFPNGTRPPWPIAQWLREWGQQQPRESMAFYGDPRITWQLCWGRKIGSRHLRLGVLGGCHRAGRWASVVRRVAERGGMDWVGFHTILGVVRNDMESDRGKRVG
jgi:hypothetical protein